MTRVRSIEEPCAANVARTVLKTSGGSDPLAEFNRALRFAVLWRRMLQGTFNAKGDRWVERILSVRETCRLRGIATFPVLVDAVTCYFKGQHPDTFWVKPL
jgi:transposase